MNYLKKMINNKHKPSSIVYKNIQQTLKKPRRINTATDAATQNHWTFIFAAPTANEFAGNFFSFFFSSL